MTATRAEYGLVSSVIKALRKHETGVVLIKNEKI